MRPGPRPSLDRDLLARLREAITTCRIVEVRYLSQSTGRQSRQRIEPYGLLYGNRAFLVGRTDWNDAMRLWRLGNMSEARVTSESFARDPGFDLESYARRSFGTFQEEPVDVVLRFTSEAKRDASAFLFHPSQIDGGERRRHAHGHASPPAASTRCAGTSSPGARASRSSNPPTCAIVLPPSAPTLQPITAQNRRPGLRRLIREHWMVSAAPTLSPTHTASVRSRKTGSVKTSFILRSYPLRAARTFYGKGLPSCS